MTTASPYYSTGKSAIYDYKIGGSYTGSVAGVTVDRSPSATISRWMSGSGYTYITPFLPGPFYIFQSKDGYSGLTQSEYSQYQYEAFRRLPKGRRGIQNYNSYGNFNINYADKFVVPGYFNTHTFEISGSTLPNPYIGSTTISGNIYKSNAWPIEGVSLGYRIFNEFIKGVNNAGGTVDLLMCDNEETGFEPAAISSNLYNAMIGTSQYTQTYFGFTSWKEFYESLGGSGFIGTGGKNYAAWWATKDAYQGVAMKQALLPTLLENNPDALMSNYDYFVEDYVPYDEYPNSVWPEDGTRAKTRRHSAGNAGAMESFGSMRSTNGAPLVMPYDGRKVFTNVKLNYLMPFNQRLQLGPWASFILTLTQARSAKRGAPNNALTPWIGSVDWQGVEYVRDYLEYKISGGYAPQTPPEVLSTRWFRNNVSVSSGFSGACGTTSGFRVVTSNSAFDTLPYASLEYYLNGITPGLTYVFSYYVNTNDGFTTPANTFQKIEHFKVWTYNCDRGITFTRELPSATGPFYKTANADYTGSSGWVEVKYKFTPYNNKPVSDIPDNLTLSLSVFGATGTTSQTEVRGKTYYFSDPKLEIEGVSGNTSLFVRSPTDELNFINWNVAPASGFGNLPVGYNARHAIYITERAGHSGYWYDYVRHLALLGTKYFGYFNPPQFVNYSYPGTLSTWINNYNRSNNGYFAVTPAGWTGYLSEQREFEECLRDINQRLGGFTLTTAESEPYDWTSTFYRSGAPALNGNTWWWRVTVKPGYTMICNGITLSSANGFPVGTWVSTTGPTFAGIGMTWKSWELPQEPVGYTAPTADINFMGMCTAAELTAFGISLTRGSCGSYIGPSGYVMYAAANQPRFDYDPDILQAKGLLLESNATNYLNFSETFATSGGCNNNWIDFNLTRTSGNTSPQNNLTAIRFNATGSNATLMSSQSVGETFWGSWSCWLRGITGTESVMVTMNGGSSWKQVDGLTTKWKRFGPKNSQQTLSMESGNFQFGLKLGNTNDSVEIWGAQVEKRVQYWGAQANVNPLTSVAYTSYIPTNNTRSSRSHDTCTASGSSFTSWFGYTQGTFLVEGTNITQLMWGTPFKFYQANMYYQVGTNQSLGLIKFGAEIGPNAVSVTTANSIIVRGQEGLASYPLDLNVKAVMTYAPHGTKISTINSFASGNNPSLASNIMFADTMFMTVVNGQQSNQLESSCHYRRIRYWNYPMDDTNMQNFAKGNVEPRGLWNPYG